MTTLEELTKKIVHFRNERNWKQFHNPKDCAISLQLEASEVLEHFQWKNSQEIKDHIKNNKGEIGEELVDVLYWVLLMSHDLRIDLSDAFDKKMMKNGKKYPVQTAKGKHMKYTKL
ncbi:MAG: nucleotide pyrophosphohydrolase [bacterium]|nr:nucleotide pyrophosphohydrolase [bacterium]